METNFLGGRFQNYTEQKQPNVAVISRGFHAANCPYGAEYRNKNGCWFSQRIEWIAREITTPWSFSVRVTMDDADSEPMMWFDFSFVEADDAMLFKLKFA